MWSVIQLRLPALIIGFHVAFSACAPLSLAGTALNAGNGQFTNPVQVGSSFEDRATSKNNAQAASNTNNNAKAASQKAVQSAASAFAGDVATVSSSLNNLGTAADKNQIKQLASAGYNAELDEDQHRAVLFKAAGSSANTPNQKIVTNTPTVLTGLKAILQSPTQANTVKQLNTIETARNAQILPSITQLSQCAFQATGVQATAQKFAATTGTQKAKKLQANTRAKAGNEN